MSKKDIQQISLILNLIQSDVHATYRCPQASLKPKNMPWKLEWSALNLEIRLKKLYMYF